MTRIKKRIVRVTNYLNETHYRCERTGWFRTNKWRPITVEHPEHGWTAYATFNTFEEAKKFMGLHESQILKTEEIVWRSDYD